MKTPFDDLFPETLFEANLLEGTKVCLACGSRKAVSVLRTIDREVIPICKHCSFNWNFYGYEILKKIKPKKLIWNLIKFKLRHPFIGGWYSIYTQLKVMEVWSARMKRWLKSRKEES
jgi:transposase-like protein